MKGPGTIKPVRVLLVEDHALVRAGIRALLEDLGGIQVVGEAGDGHEAWRLIEARRPDVILMDIAMPGLNGLEAAARVVKEFPDIRVIMVSMYSNEEYVLKALRMGASGYLLKDAGANELEIALKAVARGNIYLSPAVSKHVIKEYIERVGGTAASLEPLTPRQREILQLIAEGRTSKEIAQEMGLSVKTVETHRANLMQRLDIHDVAGLVRYAIRMGLVTPDR